MTKPVCDESITRASALTKRELRALAKRLAPSERAELRAVARALDKAIAGEPFGPQHHEHQDYDPFRCAACAPDLWVAYAIGLAFPDADEQALDQLFAGLWGLTGENLSLALDAGRDERATPEVTRAWLLLRDRHDDEEMEVRSTLEPGWTSLFGHWCRNYEGDTPPANDDETAALIESYRAAHSEECDRFLSAHSHGRTTTWQRGRPMYRLGADPALVHEIRCGSDPRKARTLKRASLRTEMDPSWLL